MKQTFTKDYKKYKGFRRFSKMRIWFLLLLIVGLIAMAYAFYSEFKGLTKKVEPQDERSLVIKPDVRFAYLYDNKTNLTLTQIKDDTLNKTTNVKTYLMIGIYCLLGAVLLVSLGVTLVSDDDAKVERASDVVKTSLGFFIGVATGFFG